MIVAALGGVYSLPAKAPGRPGIILPTESKIRIIRLAMCFSRAARLGDLTAAFSGSSPWDAPTRTSWTGWAAPTRSRACSYAPNRSQKSASKSNLMMLSGNGLTSVRSAHEDPGIAITARRLSPLPSFGSAPGPTCSALPAELRHGVGSLRVRSDGHPSDGCASSSPGPARCTRRLSCSLLRSIFSLYDATSLPFPSYRNDPQAPGLSRLVRSN